MVGKKVFICAAAEDAGFYEEIIAALNAWEVRHTELGVVPGHVTSLSDAIQNAIRDCEVFLRLCTGNTRRSYAVNLATGYFQQLLEQNRKKGRRQRRRLVNLILDEAYPLDEEEKKTLYIMAPGKSRPLWLEELAVSVDAATLTQQLSRRALFGMGVGAAVAVASAGVAGTLLVKQFQSQQPPSLPVQAKISGNPRFSFNLSKKKAASNFARVFQDGATIYAQPDLKYDASTDPPTVPDSSVYVLMASNRKQQRIPIASQPDAKAFDPAQGKVVTYDPAQSQLVAAANGTLCLYYEPSPLLIPTETSVLSVVSAHTGKELWKVTCALAGTPVLADGVVYCVLQDMTKTEGDNVYYQSSLNAFSMRDGARLWRSTDYSVDPILTPAASGGHVYIGSYLDQDHNVYCLDGKTGKKLWNYQTGGAVLGAPALANGTVYVGSQDNNVYALDAATGALRWRFASSDGFHAAPLARDGVVYAPSLDGYVYALDARSGAMFWRAYVGVNPKTDNLGDRASDSNPVTVYRNVLFAVTNGALYAFDIRDGSQRWRYIPVAEGLNTLSLPVMSDGLVLVGAADNHVYVVNP